jgi:hypothetical protein
LLSEFKMKSFIFGGDTGDTYQSIARRRALADEMMAAIGRPQNVGQGVGAILTAIGARGNRIAANKTENAGIADANAKWSAFDPFQSTPTQAPQVSGGTAFPNPAALPSQAPQTPPAQDFGGMSGIPASKSIPASALLQKPSQPQNYNSVLPSSFNAAVDKYEGGGNYDTLFGHAQNKGQFAGTRISGMTIGDAINFSDPSGAYAQSVKGQIGRVATPMGRHQIVGTTLRNAAKEMGLDPSTPFNQQTQDAIANHLAVKRINSANTMQGKIQALRSEWEGFKRVPDAQMVGIINDLQSGRGGQSQSAGQYALPEGGESWPDANKKLYQGLMSYDNQPVQVASNDPQFTPASANPQEVVPNTPLITPNRAGDTFNRTGDNSPAQFPQPQQVAQGGDDQRLQWAAEMMNSQFLDEGKKNVAKMIFEQEMKKRDPDYKMQVEAAQLGLEKSRLELEQLQNPRPEYETVSGRDGSVFRFDKRSGKLDTLYGSQPETVKPTADIQEYEYAKGQGFQGSFQDFQLAVKKAGASQVNIDQKAEGAFDKKLAEGQAETFNTMATDGMNARADIGLINQLDGLLQGQGGMGTGLAVAAGKWGIPVTEGMSDLQAADAIISKLVPTQRQPGSGSMSDRDVELFKSSLPSLWNQPGGNAIIVKTMRGLAQYKQQQGDIAQQVQMGAMSRQDAVKALKALPNPLAEFGKQDASGAPASGSIVDGYRFKGGDPSDKKNWEIVN